MAEHKMTFEVENGITKAKIDGVYMGGGKAAQVEASEEQIKDVVEDTVKANPEMTGEEPNLEGLELSGDKYAVPQGGGGSDIEIVEVTVTNWGTMDDPVHTNLTQEQMEKLSNNALIKVIDESAEWTPTICYPCAEITEENSVAYFSWILNATASSGMHELFQYLVAVDFLNSTLTPFVLSHELDTAKMFAITDANGNYRFTEGDIDILDANLSLDITYSKWSLSGTHLMIVFAGDTRNDTSIDAFTDIAVLSGLPEWIYDKIYPLFNQAYNVIGVKGAQIYADNFGSGSMSLMLRKDISNKRILISSSNGALSYGSVYHFRWQFDLLIDVE